MIEKIKEKKKGKLGRKRKNKGNTGTFSKYYFGKKGRGGVVFNFILGGNSYPWFSFLYSRVKDFSAGKPELTKFDPYLKMLLETSMHNIKPAQVGWLVDWRSSTDFLLFSNILTFQNYVVVVCNRTMNDIDWFDGWLINWLIYNYFNV